MKLYLSIKKMDFVEDNIEHNIIVGVSDKEFFGYDVIVDISDDDKFIKDTLKIFYKKDKEGKDTEEIERKAFIVKEKETWHSFPLYEVVNGEIVSFDYSKYRYFADTDRRVAVGKKIGSLYNIYAELKIHRKTLKYIMDTLQISYPDNFRIYDIKVEEIINKIPKK